jgi:hypothetical protein
MITTTTKSPPLLENNVELQLLLQQLSQKKESLSATQTAVDTKIKEIQQACTHPTFAEERSKKDSWDGINMLVAKTCTECGIKFTKPDKSSWVICENCWGPMEHLGREAGQGGGVQHYECKNCHHHHTHT